MIDKEKLGQLPVTKLVGEIARQTLREHRLEASEEFVGWLSDREAVNIARMIERLLPVTRLLTLQREFVGLNRKKKSSAVKASPNAPAVQKGANES